MQNNLQKLKIHPIQGSFCISFRAMASPCEVLVETKDKPLAIKIGEIAALEAWRIENKYSRYQDGSVLSEINHNSGKQTAIDEETSRLFHFAEQCFNLSQGLFDISSGVLRRAWNFDGSDNIPKQQQIDDILPLIGWQKIRLKSNAIQLLPNMEIDLGGLGKEYAVDRAIQLISQKSKVAVLVNFGGDLATSGQKSLNIPWQIGIDSPGLKQPQKALLELGTGALATSGDENRYLLHQGKRYSHILNPITGWPVEDPPRSLTVTAPNCIQAGFLATLGSLNGQKAESLLDAQQIRYWSVR